MVRTCDPTYSSRPLELAGITVHELPFPDGGVPSPALVAKWLKIVRELVGNGGKATIGVHCVAGMGRAPVLVAIALIEAGMDGLDAVQLIRSRRRGSINLKQLDYLKVYKKSGLKMKPKTSLFSVLRRKSSPLPLVTGLASA